MKERFPFVSAVYLLHIKDGQILLARRCNTGYKDGEYGVPAGHLDGNETARAGMVRELKEEIGITASPDDLQVVHVLQRKASNERIEFFLTLSRHEGEIRNTEPDKCDDLRFFPLTALPENTIDFVRFVVERYQVGEFYSEFGYSSQEHTDSV
ncbi:NUDIX domain-containing protein [Patescibacteria group bacterium]|nr:NUDIX domain-containing protein [Patescibacteria group bacterium]